MSHRKEMGMTPSCVPCLLYSTTNLFIPPTASQTFQSNWAHTLFCRYKINSHPKREGNFKFLFHFVHTKVVPLRRQSREWVMSHPLKFLTSWQSCVPHLSGPNNSASTILRPFSNRCSNGENVNAKSLDCNILIHPPHIPYERTYIFSKCAYEFH